jgi:alkyldihydroxyacetonephosphate synthase
VEHPLERWLQAKAAASDAMIAAGATITHHHAVGTDHKPWLAREIGPVGVAMLRGLKTAVDPTGVLNPGVLIP